MNLSLKICVSVQMCKMILQEFNETEVMYYFANILH